MFRVFFIIGTILAHVTSLTYDATSDVHWTLLNSIGSINVPCNPPSGVYTTLLDNGILNKGNFYYRYNDLNYRWVSKENWTFTTEITASSEILREERVVLEFEGLDTVAHVYLGETELSFMDNMFVRQLIDTKDIFKISRTQNLTIVFESPVNYAERVFNGWLKTYGYPILPECVDANYKGECHPNIIRKMQASFSWDWGPAFPDSGIWKPWNLVGWSTLKVHDILFKAQTSTVLPELPDASVKPEWSVTVQVWLDLAVEQTIINGEITMELDGIEYVNKTLSFDPETTELDADFNAIKFESTFIVPEGTVDLWWPNGYGSQPLYNLTVKWVSEDGETSWKTVKVGFRTIELDQSIVNQAKPENGRNFFFRINNVEVFMKGSNWIPAHVITDQVTPDYTKQLLRDAADTYQNCMRVWGGGIYETDIFYQTADELGILIWQDTMFACSMYAANEDFVGSVAKEIKTQIRRLQHHPSILLWAGNNENELALRDNWYGTQSNFDQYKNDYVTLYVDVIRNITMDMDNSRPFVVSSPSNGIKSEEDGYVAQNPADVQFGDVHHYDYYSNGWNYENYQLARFTSEYGFQSWPSLRTFSHALRPSDYDVNSPLLEHRQHHPLGQLELELQILTHMKFNSSVTTFEHYLYLTQVNQAMSMKTESEHFRRMRNNLDDNDKGNSMGALYWQLNDIWQGASWAGIEFGGRWKMLHYYVKNFFSPLLVSPYIKNDVLNINLVSDLTSDLTGLTLAIRLYNYTSFSPLKTRTTTVDAVHLRSEKVATFNLEEDFDMSTLCGSAFPKDKCFFVTSLVDSAASTIAPTNTLLLGEPKDTPLVKAKLSVVSVTEEEDNVFYIIISADQIALFVWIETEIAGTFSDNGMLVYEPNFGVSFYARELTSAQELENSLQITTLTDTY